MTPKEQAEELLKEFASRGTPFNDAGIFVMEMIYEIKKYRDHPNKESDIWYWNKVDEELEKMSKNQKTNKERKILYKKYGYKESEEKPMNLKTKNESKSRHKENDKEELEEKPVNQKTNNESEILYHDEELEKMLEGMHPNYKYLIINKVMYIFDEYEEAVFKFTGTGEGNYCKVKFKGREPYQVKCTTNIAMEALLGGRIITKDEYDKY